jgi:Peptidase family M41
VLDDSGAGQTSQLPKDDRLMVTQKEFLADIDVALGGRVAEELIFGPENVTSGASSDLRKATATATHMVKASKTSPGYIPMANVTRCLVHRIGDIRKRLAQCILTIEKRASPQANVRRLKMKCGGERGVSCPKFQSSLIIVCFMQNASSRPSQGLCASPVETAGITPCKFPPCLRFSR